MIPSCRDIDAEAVSKGLFAGGRDPYRPVAGGTGDPSGVEERGQQFRAELINNTARQAGTACGITRESGIIRVV